MKGVKGKIASVGLGFGTGRNTAKLHNARH
jgi:hypothetical protein